MVNGPTLRNFRTPRSDCTAVPVRRSFLAALGSTCALAVLLPATPAYAHSRLLHTAPAGGSTVTAPTSTVVLTFNEMVKQRFTTVVVTGPGHATYSRGGVHVVDENVNQATYPLRSGAYHVAWRAISADGHPVQGEFGFTVALAAADEPTGAAPSPAATLAATEDRGGTGWWPWLLGAVVALVAACGAVVLVRRRDR
jgi:copper resistance protein C